MAKLSRRGELAVRYAGLGWRIFPLRPGTKNGHLLRSWSRDATCDPAQVAEWWATWPEANIGLACGLSGVTVVDLDDKKGKLGSVSWMELELEHDLAPPTRAARTPSGSRHLFFRGEARTCQGLGSRDSGIDIRGAGGMGGYVLLPGSSYQPSREALAKGDVAGDYEWIDERDMAEAPAWLVTLAGRRGDREHVDAPAVELDLDRYVRWAERHLAEDARPAVSGSGGNSTTFYVACTLRERGLSEAVTFDLMSEHYNPRCEPPWDQADLRRIVANAFNYASVSAPGSDTAEADFGDAADEGDTGAAGPPPEAGGQGEPAYEGFFDEWVWVSHPKFFVRREDGRRLDVRSFDAHYGYIAEKGKLSDGIFKQKRTMRKLMDLCFRPGRGEFDGEHYNLWRPSPVRPTEGDPSVFLRHMSYLVPDDRERGLCLDFMAWIAQRPADKPTFALLMQGVEGTGKSAVGRLMERIVGEHNTARPSNQEVGSPFNAWAATAQLVIVEELMSDDKRGMANALKPLITDERISVNEKHHTPYIIENRMAFMAFTNHKDAIRLDSGDRRYMVVMSPAQVIPDEAKRNAYYERLWGFIKGDGPGVMLAYLLRRDISGFEGQGRAPRTAGHEVMRRASMFDAEAWMLEQFELGNPPLAGDLVSVQDVVEAMPERARRIGRLGNLVGQFMAREFGAVELGQHRVGASRRVLWAIRRAELLREMSAPQRAKRYLEQMAAAAGSARGPGAAEDFAEDPLR